MRIYTKILKSVCMLLALCLLFTSCSGKPFNVLSSAGKIESQNSGNEFHSVSKNTANVVNSEYISLLLDKTNYTVSVKDKTSSHLWNTLPGSANNYAYAFAVTLYTKNGIYSLNTQDNSVKFGAVSYENEGNILVVNYILSDKKETAGKSFNEITADDAYISFSVKYSVSAQSMSLEIDLSDAKYTPGGFIGDITVMPYFGSDENNDDGYILVPDGSGAVMYTGINDAMTDNISVKVYGDDPYVPDSTESASATVPVYGVKQGDSAFAAVITEGDALAEIKASRSPAFAGAVFTVTPTYTYGNSSAVNYGKSYGGKITVVYKFLSGSTANYIGMASAAREEFIANGWMSSSKQKKIDIPFYLTIDGMDKNGKILTTARQAVDILSALKGKGINNVMLRYKGLLEGGIAQNNLYKSGVNKDLGGFGGISSLYEYTQKQNYTLIPDINIASSVKEYSGSKAAASLNGEDSYFIMKNSLAYEENTNNRLLTRIGQAASAEGKSKSNPSVYGTNASYRMNLISIKRLPGYFSSFLEGRLTDFSDGYAVNDAGYLLYSDKDVTRQDAEDIMTKEVRAVLNYGALTVSGGNIYTVYNADHITDMAFSTFYPESTAYEPVPFVQAVLHGYTVYSGEPIDAGDPLYKYDMLHCIEYGAAPSFEWVFSEESAFCYSGYISSEVVSDMVTYYKDAAALLSDLTDDTITGHRKITTDADGNNVSGVYCTSYSDGSDIYVNYTGAAVSMPNNVVVGPYDYVRVNY